MVNTMSTSDRLTVIGIGSAIVMAVVGGTCSTNARFSDVNARIDDVQADVNRRFDNVNRRFDDVNRRFDDMQADVNRRFDDVQADIREIRVLLIEAIKPRPDPAG